MGIGNMNERELDWSRGPDALGSWSGTTGGVALRVTDGGLTVTIVFRNKEEIEATLRRIVKKHRLDLTEPPYLPVPGDIVQESDGDDGFLPTEYMIAIRVDNGDGGRLFAVQLSEGIDPCDPGPGAIYPLEALSTPLQKVEK